MSSLSRKFFTSLAKKYKAIKPSPDRHDEYVGWAETVISTADVLAEQAPSFDRKRFLEAAGVPEAGVPHREPHPGR